MSTDHAIDLSDFEANVPPPARYQTCWFQRLSPEHQEKVREAHKQGYSHKVMAATVSGWGLKISKSTVGNHFQENCGCND